MTREEIIKELHYHGKYTNEVKRRLRKLLKKYHPDKNKKDDKTILLLYEIKKELENNTLQYYDDTILEKEESQDNNIISKYYLYFLETMVEKLQRQKAAISKKIKELYKKWNRNIEEKNKKEEEFGKVNLKVNTLKEDINKLSGFDKNDIYLILLCLFLIIIVMITRKIGYLFGVIIIIMIEMYHNYDRNKKYHHKREELRKSEKISNEVQTELEIMENESIKYEIQEQELKKEETRIKNDIQFYHHEITKIKEQESLKEEKKNTETNKTVYKK